MYFYEKNYKQMERVLSKFLKIIVLLSVPACVGMILEADKIVLLLFGKEFMPAVLTLQILSPLICLMSLSGGVCAQILLTTNKEKVYLVCVCLGAVINAILNFILIRGFKQNGAALASVFTETVVTGTMLMVSNRIVKIRWGLNHMLTISGATAIMCFTICGAKVVLVKLPTLFDLGIEVILGVILYFGVLYLTHNKIMI